jgi:Universal stress protein family
MAAGGRPVLLATLDVPFADDATAFAVDSAAETGQPLVLVNAAEVLPTPWTLLGYGYIEREDLQDELRKPAVLAQSLAVQVERLRVCSPHPVDALLELLAERNPGLLVFGPDRSRLKPRRYRRAAKKISERATCLVWIAS